MKSLKLILIIVIICTLQIVHTCSDKKQHQDDDVPDKIEQLPTSTSTSEKTEQANSHISVLILTSIFPAHFFPLLAIGKELLTRGHRVTMLGPTLERYEHLPQSAEKQGITFISVGLEPYSEYEKLTSAGKHANSNMLVLMYNLTQLTKDEESVKNNYFIRMRKAVDNMTPSDYDYFISDNAVATILFYIKKVWNTDRIMTNFSPLPLLYPFGMTMWSYPRFGTPYTDDMSFTDRLLNTALFAPMEYLAITIAFRFMVLEKALESDESFYNGLGVKYPILYNTVFGFDWPRVTLPLQHYVGPILPSYPPPIDSTLSNWLKERPPKSVIYISMGTSADVSSEFAAAILNLSQNYSLVWSLRDKNKDVIQGMEINEDEVFISPWVSQISLLQHPSIVLTIMHCGLGSVQEALYHAVPVICVPCAWEQYDASKRLTSQGLGKGLLPTEVNPDALAQAVDHVVISESIHHQVTKISRILQASGGAKRVADLVELYNDVGSDHGIPAFVRYDWNWVQYYNADVWFVILSVIIVMAWGIKKLCKYCCCSRATKKTKTE